MVRRARPVLHPVEPYRLGSEPTGLFANPGQASAMWGHGPIHPDHIFYLVPRPGPAKDGNGSAGR